MNEQVADWIEVDESKYNQIKRAHSGVDSRSVIIEMSLSPYDVPNQVRGDYDDSSKKFVVDFKYIDSEDVKVVVLDSHMSAMVGKSSGRIYSLLIDIDAIGADSVELKIKEKKLHQDADAALAQLLAEADSGVSRSATVKSNPKNYNVAQKIIRDYWKGISQEFLGAH